MAPIIRCTSSLCFISTIKFMKNLLHAQQKHMLLLWQIIFKEFLGVPKYGTSKGIKESQLSIYCNCCWSKSFKGMKWTSYCRIQIQFDYNIPIHKNYVQKVFSKRLWWLSLFGVDHGHCYLKYTDCEVRKIFRDVGFYGKEEISATKQNKGMTLVHG